LRFTRVERANLMENSGWPAAKRPFPFCSRFATATVVNLEQNTISVPTTPEAKRPPG
jgi:hypothetical protein